MVSIFSHTRWMGPNLLSKTHPLAQAHGIPKRVRFA